MKKVIEKKISEIINSVESGLLIFDEKDKLLFINSNAEEFLAIKKKDVIGESVLSIFKNYPLDILAEALKKRKIFKKEFTIKKDLVLKITIIPVIKEKKKIGSLFILQNENKEKLDEKMKTEYITFTAHQLRTPLSVTKWAIKMILDGDLGNINKNQRKFLKDAYESNEKMISFVNDFLNMNMIEEGDVFLKPDLVDIGKIIKIMLKFYKIEANRKGIKIEFKKVKNKFPKVRVNAKKIQVAIGNILENAIKYNTEKGKIKISLNYNKENIELSIQDTGIGIPKKQQKKIFTKFFRASNAKRTKGNGLGLYISKNIIDNYNGKIWFNSKEEKGTTFYLTLPIKQHSNI